METGNIGFMLLATSLVMLMTPGLAFFYGGLVTKRNILAIMIQSFVSLGITTILWFAFGYSLCFSGDGAIIGNLDKAFDSIYSGNGKIPEYLFFAYQMMFAIITPALITGAFTNRVSFKAYLIFLVFWQVLVYYPFVHMVWGGGLLAQWGVLDFAGGIVVHATAGFAALASVFYVGKRRDKDSTPNSVPLVAIGTGLLWFGWYGFNPGSTLSGVSTDIARVAVTTTLAGAAGAVSAMFLSWIWFKKPDASMTMNGVLAGLVAITAPCAVVSPGAAVVIGLIAGALVVLSVEFIDKVLKIDDPVGAVSVHMVNGVFGTLAVGIWGNVDGVAMGVLHGGGWYQLGVQALGVLTVGVWAGVMSLLLFLAIKAVVGLRVSGKEELMGLDITEHKAEAYSGFQIFSNM